MEFVNKRRRLFSFQTILTKSRSTNGPGISSSDSIVSVRRPTVYLKPYIAQISQFVKIVKCNILRLFETCDCFYYVEHFRFWGRKRISHPRYDSSFPTFLYCLMVNSFSTSFNTNLSRITKYYTVHLDSKLSSHIKKVLSLYVVEVASINDRYFVIIDGFATFQFTLLSTP